MESIRKALRLIGAVAGGLAVATEVARAFDQEDDEIEYWFVVEEER
jgi:hypothetical protein